MQRSLKLKIGRDGGWNAEADFKLLRMLATPKKNYPPARPKAVKDAQRPMALEGASPSAVIDDTDVNGPDPTPMEMERYMEPSAEATEPNHDPPHIGMGPAAIRDAVSYPE